MRYMRCRFPFAKHATDDLRDLQIFRDAFDVLHDLWGHRNREALTSFDERNARASRTIDPDSSTAVGVLVQRSQAQVLQLRENAAGRRLKAHEPEKSLAATFRARHGDDSESNGSGRWDGQSGHWWSPQSSRVL